MGSDIKTVNDIDTNYLLTKRISETSIPGIFFTLLTRLCMKGEPYDCN